MARGTWRMDENGEMVEVTPADSAEHQRREKERLIREAAQDERDAHPGLYL